MLVVDGIHLARGSIVSHDELVAENARLLARLAEVEAERDAANGLDPEVAAYEWTGDLVGGLMGPQTALAGDPRAVPLYRRRSPSAFEVFDPLQARPGFMTAAIKLARSERDEQRSRAVAAEARVAELETALEAYADMLARTRSGFPPETEAYYALRDHVRALLAPIESDQTKDEGDSQ